MSDRSETAVQDIEKTPHILVVDDDLELLRMIHLFIEKSGFKASMAGSAEAAYHFLSEHEPEVILTDVNMPGEDGIKFLGNVHKLLPNVPVIIMTGFPQLQTAVDAIKNGAFEFICKPFDLHYLRQVLNKASEYCRLQRLEKRYRTELEETVVLRTEELKSALAQLDKTRKSMLNASHQKNEFMTTITHEMRTPMNGVIGALDLLAEEDLTGTPREYLCLARQAAENMVELINQLLSFSDRTNTSRTECNEPVNLYDQLQTVERNYRDRFSSKGITLDVKIGADVPPAVRLDGDHLSQLLDILIGNALKFTEKGGVSLEVSLEQADGNSAVIHLSVKDTGIGIPENMLEAIFEPFTQVDGSITRKYGGTGLGLGIAHQIAQLLGGTIWAESILGKGSVFHFHTKANIGGVL